QLSAKYIKIERERKNKEYKKDANYNKTKRRQSIQNQNSSFTYKQRQREQARSSALTHLNKMSNEFQSSAISLMQGLASASDRRFKNEMINRGKAVQQYAYRNKMTFKKVKQFYSKITTIRKFLK